MQTSYRNFIYHEAGGFVFAYVPKVACTNWKAILRQMEGHEDWLDRKIAHDRKASGLRYLDATGPDLAILHDPAIRKFAMVRNPYTRLLSAYLNKFEPRLTKPATATRDFFDDVLTAIERYRHEALGDVPFPVVTFEVFLRWIANREGFKPPVLWMRVNEHWARQTDLLLVPDVNYEIVGKFEEMPSDAARILAAMGSTVTFPSQSEIKFAPTGASSLISQYFTPTTRALILDWFAQDFSTFGYSTDLPA